MSLVYSLLKQWPLLFLVVLRIKPRAPCIPNKSLITMSLSAFFSMLRKALNCPGWPWAHCVGVGVDLRQGLIHTDFKYSFWWVFSQQSTRFTLSSDFGQDWFLSPQEVHSSAFSRAYSFFCPRQPLWVLPSLISIFSLRFHTDSHAVKACIFLGPGCLVFTIHPCHLHWQGSHSCFLFRTESSIIVCTQCSLLIYLMLFPVWGCYICSLFSRDNHLAVQLLICRVDIYLTLVKLPNSVPK